jgi:hypothetical protein
VLGDRTEALVYILAHELKTLVAAARNLDRIVDGKNLLGCSFFIYIGERELL